MGYINDTPAGRLRRKCELDEVRAVTRDIR